MSGIKKGQRQTPRARVFAHIRDPINRDGNRKFVELLGFTSVNTNISMTGSGTATITLPDYKSSLMRFMSIEDIVAMEDPSTGASTTNLDMAKDYMQLLLSKDQDIYFKELWDQIVVNRAGENLFDADEGLHTTSRSRGDIGANKETQDRLKKEKLVYSLPFVDLFDPIYVDYQGQDGLWYAGFTGLVTRVGDSHATTGSQALTIQCKDYSVLLDNSSLISSWHRFTTAETSTNLGDFYLQHAKNADAGKSASVNVFADLNSVQEIITEVISRAQDIWRLDDFASESVGIKAVMFDTTQVYPYEGISSRRGSTYHDDLDGDPRGMTPEMFNRDYDLEEFHYQWDDGAYPRNSLKAKRDHGLKHIFLDPLLYKFDNIFIHKMLSSSLSLFNDSMVSPDEILNDITAKMMAYKYFDANGNLIIELPKYNALPNLIDYGGRSYATALRHKDVAVMKDGLKDTIVAEKSKTLSPSDVDYEWSTINFHGKNYVLSPDDFISFNTAVDESTIKTVTSINASPPNININANLANATKYFNGSAAASFDLLAKYGVRQFQAQNIYNIHLNALQQSKILSYQAAASLERTNAQQDAGTFQLQHRPDLQVGRTYFNPLRMKSYLIMGVANAWSMGGEHTTTLTVSFGHPIHTTLDTPWSAIFAESKLFGFPDLESDLSKLRALDKDGKEVVAGDAAAKRVAKSEVT